MHANRSCLSRRRFLQATSLFATTPYVITSGALGAAGQRPASERITTALIGSGGRGQQIIEGGDQVLAVCDVDSKHAQAAKAKIDAKAGNRDCKIYRDFREVLARDDIDAVVIATPDHWHTPMAIAAIEANKAVYIEKPMTLTIDEGRQLVDVVRRYGAILQVGSQQRSDEKFIRACECVRNGRIGELRTVRVDIPTRRGKQQAVDVPSRYRPNWTTRPGSVRPPGRRTTANAATTTFALSPTIPAATSPTGAPTNSISPSGESAPMIRAPWK